MNSSSNIPVSAVLNPASTALPAALVVASALVSHIWIALGRLMMKASIMARAAMKVSQR